MVPTRGSWKAESKEESKGQWYKGKFQAISTCNSSSSEKTASYLSHRILSVHTGFIFDESQNGQNEQHSEIIAISWMQSNIWYFVYHKCSWNTILHVESENYYDTFPLLNWITNSLLIFFLEMHLFRSLFYVLTYVEQNCTNIIDTPSIQPFKWRIFFWVCWAKLCDFGFSTFHVSKTPKLGIKFQCKNSFYPNMHRM